MFQGYFQVVRARWCFIKTPLPVILREKCLIFFRNVGCSTLHHLSGCQRALTVPRWIMASGVSLSAVCRNALYTLLMDLKELSRTSGTNLSSRTSTRHLRAGISVAGWCTTATAPKSSICCSVNVVNKISGDVQKCYIIS